MFSSGGGRSAGRHRRTGCLTASPPPHSSPPSQVGVSCRKGGSYYSKRGAGMFQVRMVVSWACRSAWSVCLVGLLGWCCLQQRPNPPPLPSPVFPAVYLQPDRPFLYSVEDPNDPTNDLGRNSYNASRVRLLSLVGLCRFVAMLRLVWAVGLFAGESASPALSLHDGS